ncbi:MAG: hypothetical protein AAFY58_01100 [Planctomycetota bacterium]
MTHDQLRQALAELNGERSATFAIAGVGSFVGDGAGHLTVANAMLVPDEPDHLVKVTDGQSILIIDAERVAWVRIGLNATTAIGQ